MKATLVALNARYTHSNLAIRYLRNEISAAGHEVQLCEFSINQNYFDILDAIIDDEPDVIAFSTYIWNSEITRSIISDINKIKPHIKIIVGGPEAGYNFAQWTDLPGVSAVIRGCGEDAIRTLAEHDFTASDRVVAQKVRHFRDIHFPYIDEDFPSLANRYLYYESSRGCPFACTYCLSSREDQKIEFRSIEQTTSELDLIIRNSAFVIKFVDRSFNADPARARAIWDHCIRNAGQSRFHFEIHPLLLSEDDFTLLSSAPAGLFQFEIGIQSINEKTLREIGRKAPWSDIREKIKRLIGMKNIHIHLDMIAGLPFESLTEIAQSIDGIMDLGAAHFQLGFLKILPGTVMAEQAEDYGVISTSKAPYQILSNRWIDNRDITLLRRMDQLIDTTYNSSSDRSLLLSLADRNGGFFNAYKLILSNAERTGFDITTKNAGKLNSLLKSIQ